MRRRRCRPDGAHELLEIAHPPHAGNAGRRWPSARAGSPPASTRRPRPASPGTPATGPARATRGQRGDLRVWVRPREPGEPTSWRSTTWTSVTARAAAPHRLLGDLRERRRVGRYSPSMVMFAVNPLSGYGCTATNAAPGAPAASVPRPARPSGSLNVIGTGRVGVDISGTLPHCGAVTARVGIHQNRPPIACQRARAVPDAAHDVARGVGGLPGSTGRTPCRDRRRRSAAHRPWPEVPGPVLVLAEVRLASAPGRVALGGDTDADAAEVGAARDLALGTGERAGPGVEAFLPTLIPASASAPTCPRPARRRRPGRRRRCPGPRPRRRRRHRPRR